MNEQAALIIALGLFAHAWVSRISVPQQAANAVGWAVAIVTVVLLAVRWVH